MSTPDPHTDPTAGPAGAPEPIPAPADQHVADQHAADQHDENFLLRDAQRAAAKVKHTRSRATYLGWIVGVVVAVLLLVFIIQNGDSQEIDLVFGKVDLPVGVSLLIAALLGAILTMAVAGARIVELNRALKKVGKPAKKRKK